MWDPLLEPNLDSTYWRELYGQSETAQIIMFSMHTTSAVLNTINGIIQWTEYNFIACSSKVGPKTGSNYGIWKECFRIIMQIIRKYLFSISWLRDLFFQNYIQISLLNGFHLSWRQGIQWLYLLLWLLLAWLTLQADHMQWNNSSSSCSKSSATGSSCRTGSSKGNWSHCIRGYWGY